MPSRSAVIGSAFQYDHGFLFASVRLRVLDRLDDLAGRAAHTQYKSDELCAARMAEHFHRSLRPQ